MPTDRKPVRTQGAPAPVGPYSQAIVADGFVFTVGVVGSDPATSAMVAGGLAAEASQALDNLEAIVRAAGSAIGSIVKVTVYVVDFADLTEFDDIYASRVREPLPARTTVAVGGLPLGARVEIDCVALVSAPAGAALTVG